MAVRQTTCRLCGQDIEGHSPYRRGEWRDRGNNTHCPDDSGRRHAPVLPLYEPAAPDPRLHPESMRTLRQLVKLHGGDRVIMAVRRIVGL